MAVVTGVLPGPSVDAAPVEVVERKGIGHPDTVCDAIAERLSRALHAEYVARTGGPLHFNVDKALLVGGSARPAFGGGQITAPMELFLAGRATREAGGAKIDVEALAETAAREFFAEHLPLVDFARDVKLHFYFRPGSADLVEVYQRQRASGRWHANDTSIGAAFAPLSSLERAVLAVERRLNGPAVKAAHPAIGADVKVMGVRQGEAVRLTVACAMVGRHLRDLAQYLVERAAVAELARAAAAEVTSRPVEVQVNAADRPEGGEVYLTVTGTSAESGDDGEVGRGNRANGLITPYRPMTLEAAAGKNPVTHVGKLYNVLAREIAGDVVEAIEGVIEADCVLVSAIGRPVDEPQIAEVRVRFAAGSGGPDLHGRIERVVESRLARMQETRDRIAAGAVSVY